MNKAFVITTLICGSLVCQANLFAASEMNNEEIKNYIDIALEHLVGKQNDSSSDEDISTIRKHLNAACFKSTLWNRLFRTQVKRTADDVKTILLAGIIDFVEKQSHNYAYEKTNNTYIASKVSKNMRDAITHRILTQSGEFKPGALSRFVGNKLKQSIEEQCNRFDYVHDTTPTVVVRCKLCRGNCVDLGCIALSPCNHIVCKECAEEHFFKQQTIPRCPYCSKSIDLNDLRDKLYAPSASIID